VVAATAVLSDARSLSKLHIWEAQSLGELQGEPAARHAPHSPPQSTPVSQPFLKPSPQLGAWHVEEPLSHALLAQVMAPM
jgi:hypothetical protein